MDIPDYLADPSPDGREWIKRRMLAAKWELRRTIEELEFVAQEYQMKKKYEGTPEELDNLKIKLKVLFRESKDLAEQIRDLS